MSFYHFIHMSFIPQSAKTKAFILWVESITAYGNSIETHFLGMITNPKYNVIFTATPSDHANAKNFLMLFTGDQLQHVKSDIIELKQLTTALAAQWLRRTTQVTKSRVLKLATQLYNSAYVFFAESIHFIQYRVMQIFQRASSVTMTGPFTPFTFNWYISIEYNKYVQLAAPADVAELDVYNHFSVTTRDMYSPGKIESFFNILNLEDPTYFGGNIGGDICVQCKKSATLQCARCKNVHYCSTDCQATDWRTGQHNLVCVANKE